jgi:alkaline phosphatase
MGTEYRDSNACLQRLLAATQSFATITPKLEKRATAEPPAEGSETPAPRGPRYVRPSAELVKEVTSAAWGYDLTAAEIEQVRNGAERVRQSMNRQFDSLVGALGQVASNHNGVGWTGVSHTADYSTVTALGAGAQRFEGFLRNTDIFPILCDFMGVKFRNPSMTPEKAKQYRAAIMSPNAPHWV